VLQAEIDPDLILGWNPWCIVLFDEEGEGESDGITNFCSSYLSQVGKFFGPGDSSPTYAGLRLETL